MKRPKKHGIRRTAAFVAVLALTLGACGDGDDPPVDPGPDPGATNGEDPGTPPDGDEEVDEHGAPLSLVEAAEQEGQLLIYSADTPEHNELPIAAFREIYDIDVEFVRLNTDALIQRYGSERTSGVVDADIIIMSDGSFFTQNPDWFVPLDDLGLASLDAYPDNQRGERWASASTWPLTIQYNTDLVDEADVPQSWEDVLDPRFQGQILLNDPRASPSPMSWAGLMRRLYGDEFLEGLAAQDIDLIESASPGAQQVAAGVYALNFPAAGGANSAPLVAEGAPISFVVLEPTVTPANMLGISEGASNPNAAALYANFRLSEAGHTAVCSNNPQYGVPIPVSIEGCLELPGDVEPADFELWNNQDARREILDLLGIG